MTKTNKNKFMNAKNINKLSSKKEKIKPNPDYQRYQKAVERLEFDPVAAILRSHLLAECYLDTIILSELPRGDIIIDKRFTFLQKLIIVESLDRPPRYLIDSLRNLNKVRNDCSHVFEYQISESDVDKIGRPLTNEYLKKKMAHSDDVKSLLAHTIGLLLAQLSGATKRITNNPRDKK